MGDFFVTEEKKYNFINAVVIVLTALLFIDNYRNIIDVFRAKDFLSILVLIVAVLLVHVIKAGRLFLILFGLNVDSVLYMKTYCKVTSVSVVIPFKLGEFFRMYCYGKQLGNIFRGVVIILLDRFMDTIALMTAILLVLGFNGGQITVFIYILLIFLAFILMVYFVFPDIYKFWKTYLLESKASENKLKMLKLFSNVDLIYREIKNITNGKGMILYSMSLIAWGIEIGNIALLNNISGGGKLDQIISNYLISAMSGDQSTELKLFVFTSVISLMFFYLIIKVGNILFTKEVNR